MNLSVSKNIVMSEHELIKQAQNNNQQAFKKIFEKYYNLIFHMINQMVRNTMLSEDLTMETFEKAFKDIKNFTPKHKLSTWIYKIGKNHTIDHIRKEGVKPKFIELDTMIKNQYTPEQEFIGKEQAQILETAITHLNEKHKKIIYMKMDGLKCVEIAKILNMPPNTVIVYMKVLRKKIMIEQHKKNKNHYF